MKRIIENTSWSIGEKCQILLWVITGVVSSNGSDLNDRCKYLYKYNDTIGSPITSLNCNGINSTIPHKHFCFPQFDELKNLTWINSLDLDVENGAFDCLENLLSLNLTNNHVHPFEFPVFSNLKSLKELDLSNNELEFYEGSVPLFSKLYDLTTLILKNNEITSLVDNIFSDLKELKFLDLQCNKIRRIPENVFVSQKKLITLHLDFNYHLEVLPMSSLLPLNSLEHLGLKGIYFECNCNLTSTGTLLWNKGKELKITSDCKSLSIPTTFCTILHSLNNDTNISKEYLKSEIIYVSIALICFLAVLAFYFCYRFRKIILHCSCKRRLREEMKSVSIQYHEYEYINPLEFRANTISTNAIPTLPRRHNEFVYETIKTHRQENRSQEETVHQKSTNMKETVSQISRNIGVQSSSSASEEFEKNKTCFSRDSTSKFSVSGDKRNFHSNEYEKGGRITINSLYSENNN
ncbi:hypothetical protein C0J52_12114 [Blattella germanica]|nr:hypothetical protein C0J52_12114 [Blattella germanica]